MRFSCSAPVVANIVCLLLVLAQASCLPEVQRKVIGTVDDKGKTPDVGSPDALGDAADGIGDALADGDGLPGDGLPGDGGPTDGETPPDVTADVPVLDAAGAHLVGAEGGDFLFTGNVLLSIPAGALEEEIELVVTLSEEEIPGALGLDPAVTAVWELGPAGTQFAEPVTVILPLLEGLEVSPYDWVKLVAFVGEPESYNKVPAALISADSVQLETDHFSLAFAGLNEPVAPGCVPEVCDGLDNDCDGEADQGLGPVTCGFGPCEHTVESCVEGVPFECDPFEGAETEICDGVDNDCDGSVDEGLSLSDIADLQAQTECRTGGICAGGGVVAACGKNANGAAAWLCNYDAVDFNGDTGLLVYEGKESACDNYDTNCDGEVDEGACPALTQCDDNPIKCQSGACVKPLEEAGEAMYCTSQANNCLAGNLIDGLVEIEPNGVWCQDKDNVAICMTEGGGWNNFATDPDVLYYSTCADIFGDPTLFMCDVELNECSSGCDSDEACIAQDTDLCDGTTECVDGACLDVPDTAVVCNEDTECMDSECIPETAECQDTSINDQGECDDGDLCTGPGTCSDGACLTGEALDCDDANPCTVDSCDGLTGECAYDADFLESGLCDTGNLCKLDGVCTAGVCEAEDVDCADESPCTADSCDTETGDCIHDAAAALGSECDDLDACTEADTCDAEGACAGTALDCDDSNECTGDTCDSELGCQYTNQDNDTPCVYVDPDSGEPDECYPNGKCDGLGACDTGLDICVCHDESQCVGFDDGNLCNGIWWCADKFVGCAEKPDSVVECPADNDTQCALNLCQTGTGLCELTPVQDGTGCDDGSQCTVSDACDAGVCVGETLDCDDANVCTDDSCDVAAGCINAPNSGACDDGASCTIGDHCEAGTCVFDQTTDCDDGDPCTQDDCDEAGQCLPPSPIDGCCQIDDDCETLDGEVCFQFACCAGDCGGKECGGDGCGGTCGECPGLQVCADGACCSPVCLGKECGDDGCGGECGICGEGDVCDLGGSCCPHDLFCEGKECGTDYCGGTCGECDPGFKCNELGACEVCVPDCDGKDCGEDGCGGSCGVCEGIEVCDAQGQCCAPDCTGKGCGDDGCGGDCGDCEDWEACVDFQCACDVCCEADDECAYNETCSGSQQGVQGTVCEVRKLMFTEGFEKQAGQQGSPSNSFTYSWTFGNPWKVFYSEDGSLAASGDLSHVYDKTGTGNAAGSFYFDTLVPTVPPGTAKLSLNVYCLPSAASWQLLIKGNGSTVKSLNGSVCTGEWTRVVADLAAVAGGKVTVEFKLSKSSVHSLKLYVDDISVLVDDCPEPACAQFTTPGGICTVDSVVMGKCFVNYECFDHSAVEPGSDCNVCDAFLSPFEWSTDQGLCDDQNPATQDLCVDGTCDNF